MAPKDEYKPKSNSKSEMNKPKGGKAKVNLMFALAASPPCMFFQVVKSTSHE